MSSFSRSTVTPLYSSTPIYQNDRNQIRIINPNETIINEPLIRYETGRTIRRTYLKPPKSKYRYTVEQEGKSYRCCQWCRYWCTRKCPIFDFCDRIVSCPLLFFILSGLLLLSLLIALLTLFGLHPNINSARRYYGTISKLSILNRTKYIYNLDQLCSRTNVLTHCLNIVTSTGIVQVSTTITINRTASTVNYSYILLVSCLIIYCVYRRVCFYST